ncbi:MULTISPECIES: DUF6261 family protein [Flavobacterium]|uniref:DUF6261 family protein n=1 Tax=Flavobacterium TaxID=237 RepID=UPI001FCBE284|nr:MULTISPECIES: DUF6261 family protein [Flavobacterium]UOK43686.1 DUF6261 family protein [Flavobacterium enshiense]
MINSITLNSLRNAEFIQFCKDFTSIVANSSLTVHSLQIQHDTMVRKISEMETMFKNTTPSPITPELEELDWCRNKNIMGIFGIVNAYTCHFDPTYSYAATLLQNNIKLYGSDITRETYQSETAIISNIISDWETKPELTSAIGTLNLGQWVIELKKVNQTFRDTYHRYTQEFTNNSPGTFKSKRNEMVSIYHDLCKYLSAFSVVQPISWGANTIHEVNTLINQYNQVIVGRTTSVKTEKTVPVSSN